MTELNIARLQTDEGYFEERRIELAESIMAEVDAPITPLEALDLAQDKLLALVWG